MSKICAGIVSFCPEISRLKQSLQSVTAQAEKVFVVDNHSENLSEVKKLVMSFPNVALLENEQNNGIAKALNQMCELAEKEGYEWILTLDQDSLIPRDLLKIFQNYLSEEKIGIICPAVYYEGWEKKAESETPTESVSACMTSASLTKIQAWKEVGGFREEYFIDYVDNEFCMKLRLHQYKVLRVNGCQMHHQLGDSGIKKIFGLKLHYTRHNPLRLYYMARNNYAFIREYAKSLPLLKEYLKLVYVLSLELLFSKQKRKAIRFIRYGLRDARKGISGAYRE